MNVVVLEGRVVGAPTLRTLKDGSEVVSFDLVTATDAGAIAVPVSASASLGAWADGQQLIVTGVVRRRFFFAGGVTQSRTEVAASAIATTRRSRAGQRLLDGAIRSISAAA
jgi:single-strand DNA-binding protein